MKLKKHSSKKSLVINLNNINFTRNVSVTIEYNYFVEDEDIPKSWK